MIIPVIKEKLISTVPDLNFSCELFPYLGYYGLYSNSNKIIWVFNINNNLKICFIYTILKFIMIYRRITNF